MRGWTKHLTVILVSQAAILAVGLWMSSRYVRTSAAQAAYAQVWERLGSRARSAASELGGLAASDLGQDTEASARLALALDARPQHDGGLAIVDPQWTTVFPGSRSPDADAAPPALGSRVMWQPGPHAPESQESDLYGRISLADVPQLAAACALGRGAGYVLAYEPLHPIEAQVDTLLQALPMITGLTFVWMCVLLGIPLYVVLARLRDDMEKRRSRSATETLRQTQNLVRTRDAVIFGLAKLAESRDVDTGNHLERISVYSTTLASALRRDPRFKDKVTPAFMRLIGISSALHDIGKVGVEDRILRKPGPLTSEEWALMRRHAAIGGECLRDIEQHLGGSNFLQMAREIAFAHHESWDGNGYPKGLVGRAIPLAARIVTIVDVYDALSSARVYKEAFSHEECVAVIREEAGKKLDPDIVDIWLTIESRFRGIAAQFANRSSGRRSTSVALEIEPDAYREEAEAEPTGAASEALSQPAVA